MHWKLSKSETDYQNPHFKVSKDHFEKPDGKSTDYYKIHRSDCVLIAAFTKEMEIVMIRQYRPPVHSVDLEVPAGLMDKHEKNPLETVKRELLEETGYQCKNIIKLAETFTSAGLLNNKAHFYIGFEAQQIAEPQLDENEEIELKILPWKKALEELEKGSIKDLGSAHCLLLAKEYLSKQS